MVPSSIYVSSSLLPLTYLCVVFWESGEALYLELSGKNMNCATWIWTGYERFLVSRGASCFCGHRCSKRLVRLTNVTSCTWKISIFAGGLEPNTGQYFTRKYLSLMGTPRVRIATSGC